MVKKRKTIQFATPETPKHRLTNADKWNALYATITGGHSLEYALNEVGWSTALVPSKPQDHKALRDRNTKKAQERMAQGLEPFNPSSERGRIYNYLRTVDGFGASLDDIAKATGVPIAHLRQKIDDVATITGRDLIETRRNRVSHFRFE